MKREFGWVVAAAIMLSTACDDDTSFVEVRAILQASPGRLDFGAVEVTQQARQTVQVTNLGGRFLDLTATVEDDCDGCFILRSSVDDGIGAGQTLPVDVSFRPRAVGAFTATVTFASSVDGVEPLTVFARGEGIDGRRPDIEVSPTALDFGGAIVPVGPPAFDRFRILSTGEADLIIDAIRIEPPGSPFDITTSTGTSDDPAVIPPGDDIELTVRVQLDPSVSSTATAEIVIDTNVLEDKNVPGIPGRVILPVTTQGNLPPVAVIEAPTVIDPFTRVDVDARGSFDPDDPPDLPLSYTWTLVDVPAGSQARLQSRSAPTSAFFADVTGSYQLRLEVTDGIGLVGDATQVIEARPDEGIRVELVWDHPDSDVDLHFIRDGGEFCDCGGNLAGAPSDVHYRCMRPDWYPEAPGANPILDVDDDAGFGPEVLIIEGDGEERLIPEDRFRIEVHYFNDKDEVSSFPTTVSNATVRVFFSGRRVAEYDRALASTGVRWVVAEIDWPAWTLTEIDQAFDGFGCGLFSDP